MIGIHTNKVMLASSSFTSAANRQMVRHSVRAFGGGHGGPPHEYKYDHLPSRNAKYQVPSDHDEAYQLPKKATGNVHFHQWLMGRWNVDRDNILDNTKYNKFSLYHVLSNPV